MGLAVGSTLGGRYELVRELGSGGMGVVWLARHRELGTQVAIKALRPEVMTDKEAVTRFDREARAAASLKSPHVTRILDVGRNDDGTPFMVMEYLEGNDLGAELANSGPLTIGDAARFLCEACEAMIEAHEGGIIHRDLKPENLFLARTRGASDHARSVKVLDFGISRFTEHGQTRVTQTQSSFGTPLYMSPEQVRSTKNVDHRTDIWSLGVIFYELLTGDPPFNGETPTAVAVAITIDKLTPIRERRPDVPEELEAVITRALDRDPAKRFQSMRELADAIAPFQSIEQGAVSVTPRVLGARGSAAASKTLRVSNAEVPARTGASSKRTPAWLVAGVALLTFAVSAAAFFALKSPSSKSSASGANGTDPHATSTGAVITPETARPLDTATATVAKAVDVTPEPTAIATASATASAQAKSDDKPPTKVDHPSRPATQPATAAPVVTSTPVAQPPPPPPVRPGNPLHL